MYSKAMKPKSKSALAIVIAMALVVALTACGGGSSEAGKTTAPSAKNAVPSSATEAKKAYASTLEAGYYEIGIDIPAGTYDFELVSGSGNVFDIGDSVNLMMGKGENFQQSYKNAELKDGNTLVLSQCSIKISSKAVNASLKKRDNTSAKEIVLSSGKYTAGKDFQPGYYDITLVSGSGNVICEDNQLNAMIGSDTSMFVKGYKNVPFKDGNKLEIEGPKVKLTPSK